MLFLKEYTHIERVSFDIYDLIFLKNQIITIYLFLSIIYKIVIWNQYIIWFEMNPERSVFNTRFEYFKSLINQCFDTRSMWEYSIFYFNITLFNLI